ncbi:MAG: hypothetical protein WDM85_12120 [Caulobacteraceae bacterium]
MADQRGAQGIRIDAGRLGGGQRGLGDGAEDRAVGGFRQRDGAGPGCDAEGEAAKA